MYKTKKYGYISISDKQYYNGYDRDMAFEINDYNTTVLDLTKECKLPDLKDNIIKKQCIGYCKQCNIAVKSECNEFDEYVKYLKELENAPTSLYSESYTPDVIHKMYCKYMYEHDVYEGKTFKDRQSIYCNLDVIYKKCVAAMDLCGQALQEVLKEYNTQSILKMRYNNFDDDKTVTDNRCSATKLYDYCEFYVDKVQDKDKIVCKICWLSKFEGIDKYHPNYIFDDSPINYDRYNGNFKDAGKYLEGERYTSSDLESFDYERPYYSFSDNDFLKYHSIDILHHNL